METLINYSPYTILPPYTAQPDVEVKVLLIVQHSKYIECRLANLYSLEHSSIKTISGLSIVKLPSSIEALEFRELPIFDTRIVEVHTCSVMH